MKVERFKKITEEMTDLFTRKNHDYGNSFEKIFREYGLLSSVIRLKDKLGRVEVLMTQEAKVKDESIKDSLKDMATYCIMTLVEMERLENKEIQNIINCARDKE